MSAPTLVQAVRAWMDAASADPGLIPITQWRAVREALEREEAPIHPAPSMSLAASALLVTAGHIAACRMDLQTSYEHPTHRESVSADGCRALDALAVVIKALSDACGPIENGSDALEGIVDQIHDMASDITGACQERMEQPAFDATADWAKHEGIAA